MFLDPDPKGRDSKRSSSGSASPFFASQTPIASPREQSWRIKRSPLQDSSPTFKNNQFQRRSTSTGDDGKPTVRLVRDSPVSTPRKGSDSENVLSGQQDSPAGDHAPPHTSLLASHHPASASETGSPAASRVSDGQSILARVQKLDLPPTVTLLPSAYSKHLPDPSRTTRRSTSSKYSSGPGSSNDLNSSFTGSESNVSRAGRLSDRSTLDEDEIPDSGNEEGSGPIHLKPSTLETVPESTPERSAAPSVSSKHKRHDSDSDARLQPLEDERSSAQARSYPALPWTEQTERTQYSPQDSLGSLQASTLSLPRSPPQTLSGQDSQETLAYDYPQTSSPNFIAYSDSTNPNSPESVLHNAGSLHNASSFDSIVARLGTPSIFRPTTSGSAAVDSTPTRSTPIRHQRSRSSDSPLRSSTLRQHQPSSNDTPTRSPALRHQRSLSADSYPLFSSPPPVPPHDQSATTIRPNSLAALVDMNFEEIDLEPWPRQQFSSHLSTIASESDRAMSPAQFSHFSMGSGVLTIDDASSIPLSGYRSSGHMSSHMSSGHMSSGRYSGHLSNHSMGRRASEPYQSPTRRSSPESAQRSEEEAGDMTLGLFREGSAKPEPLFLGRQMTPNGGVRYDGPLPPLPPMPTSRHGPDEDGDSLSALSAPSLKKKRSGYSVRGRSNSTPSGSISRHNSVVSYCDSDRWSRNSSVFPMWAKNFYGGYGVLLSASKISLSNPPTPRRSEPQAGPPGHFRNMSQWTQGSITSRLGTGYSEIDNVSPTSSHFLPSIFRPRTRTLGASDKTDNNESRSFKFGKQKRKNSQPRSDERPDSMAIEANPYPDQAQSNQTGETLPSGHPKYGVLKDESSNPPPMPPLRGKYSKQKLWDEMSFPRPMTKDRLSDFRTDTAEQRDPPPHLHPNKSQASKINKWRSPSFVESFDTLFNSRGNRQILLFALGFLFPFFWLLGALLPLPPRHSRDAIEAEKALPGNADSEDDLNAALYKHHGGDARLKWDEERVFLKAKWWRTLNRVMCFVGVGIIAAVIALAIIATR